MSRHSIQGREELPGGRGSVPQPQASVLGPDGALVALAGRTRGLGPAPWQMPW